MFEYASFVNRNPLYALKNWRGQSDVRRAMLDWREHHKECAWCGRTNRLEVHHIIPVSADPLLAANYDNFITLCRPDHLRVGHNGNLANSYKEDINDACKRNRVVKIVKEKGVLW